MPKIFHFDFDRNIFVFMGGFLLTSHLVFVARETKGTTFTDFVNYLFMFSILYIINLLIFSTYLTVAFEVDSAKIVVSGLNGGAILIRNLFT